MSDIPGGCYCGAIRYRITDKPKSGICYCASCRKATGAQSVAWLGTTREHVEILQGEPTRYTAPNGAIWTFCGTCGSTLFWEPDAESKVFTATTGSADNPERFPPDNSSWDEERLPWDKPVV